MVRKEAERDKYKITRGKKSKIDGVNEMGRRKKGILFFKDR